VFDVDEFIVVADHDQTIMDILNGYGSNVAAVALNRPVRS
jgi:hypothetical protein